MTEVSYAVLFFAERSGNQPARDWLRGLPASQKRAIGEDLKVLQYRWPLGMPLVRKLDSSLWELRTKMADGIARVFFTVWERFVVVLHGFIKKSQRTPKNELETARRRLRDFKESVT